MDLLPSSSPCKTSSSSASAAGDSSVSEAADDAATEDNAPLFYTPGKRGFCSPRQGRSTFERINAFRNTGRCVKYFFALLN